MDKVVIITLNFNKSDFSIECVNSLLESNYSNYKILLIDNGSQFSEFEKLSAINDDRVIVKRFDINYGYVGGINKGLDIAKDFNADHILIMNNDTLIEKDAMSNLVEIAKKYNNKCIVSGKVYNIDEPNTLQYIGQYCSDADKLKYPPVLKTINEKDNGQYDMELKMAMLDDIFWLLPRYVFDKIGYYSNYFFMYGEQNDYALRAVKNDIELIYTPNAKIWHYHHLSSSDNPNGYKRIRYWQTYGTYLLAYLHLSKLNFIKFFSRAIIKSIIETIAYHFLFKFEKYKKNIQPKNKAILYFIKWMLNKEENKGFNPYK